MVLNQINYARRDDPTSDDLHRDEIQQFNQSDPYTTFKISLPNFLRFLRHTSKVLTPILGYVQYREPSWFYEAACHMHEQVLMGFELIRLGYKG